MACDLFWLHEIWQLAGLEPSLRTLRLFFRSDKLRSSQLPAWWHCLISVIAPKIYKNSFCFWLRIPQWAQCLLIWCFAIMFHWILLPPEDFIIVRSCTQSSCERLAGMQVGFTEWFWARLVEYLMKRFSKELRQTCSLSDYRFWVIFSISIQLKSTFFLWTPRITGPKVVVYTDPGPPIGSLPRDDASQSLKHQELWAKYLWCWISRLLCLRGDF